MARLFTSGAEFSTTADEGISSAVTGTGTATMQSTTKRSGTYGYKVDSGASGNIDTFFYSTQASLALGRSYYIRFYVLVPSATGYPTGNNRICMFYRAGAFANSTIYMTSAGALRIDWGDPVGTNPISGTSNVLAQDTWYRVEFRVKYDTGALEELELRLDGSTVASATGINASDQIPNRLLWGYGGGTVGANKSIYYDDIALNDDQGANQNSWPGPGKVVLSLPISDNSRGTWTGGIGGTTNLWQAIDNVPPTGTATETDTSQIENAQNTASAPGDFNMTAPSTLGMALGDTMSIAQLKIVHGEDVALNTSTGTCTIVSNPAQGGTTAFTFGDDVGLLGTHPSNWATHTSTLLYAPSVTYNTSPVARVTKTTASTKVGSVEQMAITFEYAPPMGRKRFAMMIG